MALFGFKTQNLQVYNPCGMRLESLARALRELQASGLIRCITGSVKMGKIYALTKDGLDVRKKLVSMEL